MQCLGLEAVSKVFLEEAEQLSAKILDHALTTDALFMRAETGERREVAKGDEFAAGVALKMEGASVQIRPYALRLMCVNGAVLPCLGERDQIDLALLTDRDVQESRIRDSIRDCARAENLRSYLNGMHNLHDPVAFAIVLSEFSRRFGGSFAANLIQGARPQGRSGYELLNAITAMAREETDHRRKWELEAFGGEVPALVEQCSSVRNWSQALELPTGELVKGFA